MDKKEALVSWAQACRPRTMKKYSRKRRRRKCKKDSRDSTSDTEPRTRRRKVRRRSDSRTPKRVRHHDEQNQDYQGRQQVATAIDKLIKDAHHSSQTNTETTGGNHEADNKDANNEDRVHKQGQQRKKKSTTYVVALMHYKGDKSNLNGKIGQITIPKGKSLKCMRENKGQPQHLMFSSIDDPDPRHQFLVPVKNIEVRHECSSESE